MTLHKEIGGYNRFFPFFFLQGVWAESPLLHQSLEFLGSRQLKLSRSRLQGHPGSQRTNRFMPHFKETR